MTHKVVNFLRGTNVIEKHCWQFKIYRNKIGVSFLTYTYLILVLCCFDSVGYFTSSYIIGTGYQDFPFVWYNYGTKTRLLLHFFTGNTFKELFAKVRKISDTRCSYDVLISTLDGRLSGCPIVPSIPSSSHPLTVMARLVSDRELFRNKSRISENGVGLIRLSGCIIPKKADKLPSVDVVRQVASGLNRLHRCAYVGTVVIGGMGIWGIWVCTWGLLGMMGGR